MKRTPAISSCVGV